LTDFGLNWDPAQLLELECETLIDIAYAPALETIDFVLALFKVNTMSNGYLQTSRSSSMHMTLDHSIKEIRESQHCSCARAKATIFEDKHKISREQGLWNHHRQLRGQRMEPHQHLVVVDVARITQSMKVDSGKAIRLASQRAKQAWLNSRDRLERQLRCQKLVQNARDRTMAGQRGILMLSLPPIVVCVSVWLLQLCYAEISRGDIYIMCVYADAGCWACYRHHGATSAGLGANGGH
jgi:hypothetical protein